MIDKNPNRNNKKEAKIDRLMDEDFLFLLLTLIDYPEKNPGILHPEQLKKFRFKKLNWKNCFNFLLLLERDTGIKFKVIEKNFPEIEVSEKSIKNIQRLINRYLKKFISGKLIPVDKNYFNFEKQKQYFIKKILKRLEEKTAKIFFLSDNEIDDGYRFFESLLILEKQKYLEIKNITNSQKLESEDYYKIVFSINQDKFLTNNQRTIFCEKDSGFGFIKFGERGERIKISKATSQPYKLLLYLSEPFGTARSIDTVFEVIKTERSKKLVENNGVYLGANEKINAIKNVRKELQKIKGFTKIIKIEIDKQRKMVWLAYK
ncbi:hypothetical protein BMS3Abin15_01219 [bacterium BMS3Abin15]|nr:hypothetical protein BMS3Abin15_01219 [bacterium BMS3Abin15]